jgi:hypothetical protein
MKDNLEHIDRIFKDKLEHYAPAKTSNKWFILGFKLILLNLSSYFVYGSIVVLLGLTAAGTLYFYPDLLFPAKRQMITPYEIQANRIPITMKGTEETTVPEVIPYRNNYSTSSFSSYSGIASDEGYQTNPNHKTVSGQSGVIPGQSISENNTEQRKATPEREKTIAQYGASALKLHRSGLQNSNGGHEKEAASTALKNINLRHEHFDSLTFMSKRSVRTELQFSTGPSWIFNSYKKGTVESGLTGMVTSVNYQILSFNGGTEIKISRNNWFLQTGVNLSVYGEDIHYQYQSPVVVDDELIQHIDTITRLVFDPPNIGVERIVRIDTVYLPYVYFVDETLGAKNRYFMLEVPVMAGRQFYLNQFRMDISTGIALGFRIKSTGYVPGSRYETFLEGKEYSIVEPSVAYLFRTGLYYPVSPKLMFMVKPSFRFNLNQFIEGERVHKDLRYYGLDLKIGLVFDL